MQLLLKPNWFRSTMVISQAKQYFADFSTDENAVLDENFIDTISKAHTSVKDYLCYILVDFAMVDTALEEVPAGWAFQFAEDIQLREA